MKSIIRYLLSVVLLVSFTTTSVAAIIKFKVCNNGTGLQSRLTGEIYWVEHSDPHGSQRANEEHCFPSPIPDFVDWALLDCRVVTCFGVIDPILTVEDEKDAFIVLDSPVGPMSPPWVRYLKYACTWARYRTDEYGMSHWDAITNNWTDAAQRITFGLYFQRNQSFLPGGFAYPNNSRAYWVGEDVFTFYLGELLINWESGIITSGNCVDAFLALSCALCSVGVDFGNRQLSGDMRYFSEEELPDPEVQEAIPGYQFKTNPICPIGSNPLDDNKYFSYVWIMHQISILWNEEFSPYSRVWCATSSRKLDLSGSSYRNPPAHHPPSSHLWPLKDFWQKDDLFLGWLGLILDPFQTQDAPYLIDDWKCSPTTVHRQ
jgi:hypothetical protein